MQCHCQKKQLQRHHLNPLDKPSKSKEMSNPLPPEKSQGKEASHSDSKSSGRTNWQELVEELYSRNESGNLVLKEDISVPFIAWDESIILSDMKLYMGIFFPCKLQSCKPYQFFFLSLDSILVSLLSQFFLPSQVIQNGFIMKRCSFSFDVRRDKIPKSLYPYHNAKEISLPIFFFVVEWYIAVLDDLSGRKEAYFMQFCCWSMKFVYQYCEIKLCFWWQSLFNRAGLTIIMPLRSLIHVAC